MGVKRIKECDHCSAKFKNRRSLRRHLMFFHEFALKKFRPVKPAEEGKPLRKARLIAHTARLKKEDAVVNRRRIGQTRTGRELPLILYKPGKRRKKNERRTRLKGVTNGV